MIKKCKPPKPSIKHYWELSKEFADQWLDLWKYRMILWYRDKYKEIINIKYIPEFHRELIKLK